VLIGPAEQLGRTVRALEITVGVVFQVMPMAPCIWIISAAARSGRASSGRAADDPVPRVGCRPRFRGTRHRHADHEAQFPWGAGATREVSFCRCGIFGTGAGVRRFGGLGRGGGAKCGEPVGAEEAIGRRSARTAPLRVITSSASGPVNRVLTGTSVAPADSAPNAASTH